ncbi:hypothetical protein [Streptomyces sp. NPDC051546]|uniref:hypothetical protein n=1 Tax=Streptomyces sp. NPDC051546 TaxID=3365655 RepID=UPI0037BC1CBD
MNPLHRAPDWDQQAHRHTPLTDPVVTVRQIGHLGLHRRPPTRIDHALVYTTAQGGYSTYLPPQRPRRIPRRWTAVYEVDMGVHPVRTLMALPSYDDALEFDVTVELDWQVTDPAQFVRSGHRDVPRLLLGELEQVARPVTRRFPISDSAVAEAEVLAVVRQLKPLGEGAGLRTIWTIRLRRDGDNLAHARRLQAIEHDAAERDLTQHRRWELQQHDARMIEFYREYLARGGADAWALHLAQHPEDTAKALESLHQDERDRLRSQMALIRELLAKDGTEPFELAGPRQLAIDTVHQILSEYVPDDPVHSPALTDPPPSPSSLVKTEEEPR